MPKLKPDEEDDFPVRARRTSRRALHYRVSFSSPAVPVALRVSFCKEGNGYILHSPHDSSETVIYFFLAGEFFIAQQVEIMGELLLGSVRQRF